VDAEAVAEEPIAGDLQLGAGLHQAEHGVASGLAGFADGSTGDLAFGDDGADVVFGAVGVKRDLRPVEDAQQLGLSSMKPPQLAVQEDIAGLFKEDRVEPGAHHSCTLLIGVELEALEVRVKPPDQPPGQLDRFAMDDVGGLELVDEVPRVDPAQGVVDDAELSGPVRDDDRALSRPCS